MNFNTEIIFSDRRTVAITVSSDNKVTLRCPKGMSRERAERFLRDKSGWIEKIIEKNNKKNERFADIISFENILVNGERKPFKEFVASDKNVQKVFVKAFAESFTARVEEISEYTGLKFNGIKIKNFKARWGSCDAKNNLQFNYKLFMLPVNIQNYIIIHELCHTAVHNHSLKFWRLVESFAPDYKFLRAELKGYNFITTLY